MTTTGKIVSCEGDTLTVKLSEPLSREISRMESDTVEIRLNDGRSITAEQRRAVFATIRDISLWSGHDPEYLRAFLTWDFCWKSERDPFSLSDCPITTAREFLNYLIDFCLTWSVPTKESLSNRTDDGGRYMYYCIEHAKCAVCNMPGEVHHIDTVGANGGNRRTIDHRGLRAVCLCRLHHTEAHQNEREFLEKHHIEPIKLDAYLCRIRSLNIRKE
nr:MAG TPA: Putative HNHc nuclease [Caudoviricetes sp.]